MSVEELQAQIQKASDEVDFHTSSLLQAKQKKIALYRQLNALRDPLMRLPLEISGKIFLACVETDAQSHSTKFETRFLLTKYTFPNAKRAPLLLLNVCHAWTRIALATRALWASVEIQSTKQFDTWLNRAGAVGLKLMTDKFYTSIAATILGRANQLHSLDLQLDSRGQLDAVAGSAPFPNLKVLVIIIPFHAGFTPRLDQVLRLLQLAPNLSHYTFEYWLRESMPPPAEGTTVTHSILESLSIIEYDGFPDVYSQPLLAFVTLPRLSSLSAVLDTDSKITTLAQFLTRSEITLRELFVVHWISKQLLPLVSMGLTHIGIRYDSHGFVLKELVRNPRENLPRLTSLVVRDFIPGPYEMHYHGILAIMRAGFPQLRTLILLWDKNVDSPTQYQRAMPLIAALRPFAEDGVDIHVGTEDKNLMDIPNSNQCLAQNLKNTAST
ncbi:hypothetical protein C8F01DRAFT_1161042 [Mycena amicta]|nr:hypothetical protein C8F01DRAFT_1161042 [Mycena amicta]